jgi:hypothetical protein
MPSRVAKAVFDYVRGFVSMLGDEQFMLEVAWALEHRILAQVDWEYIPVVELIDTLLTLLRRESQAVRRRMVLPLNLAFRRKTRHHAIFTILIDRGVGPEYLFGEADCPNEPNGPVDCLEIGYDQLRLVC